MTENTTLDFLDQMLAQLKHYKSFPKYQLERRVDILISLFLADIIKEYVGPEHIPDFIVPELPIKRDTGNQSTNIDYFAYCRSRNTGFLIELKTDSNSCSSRQLHQYLTIQQEGFGKVIKGIETIRSTTLKKHQKKYDNILNCFHGNGVGADTKLEIMYILPEKGKQRLMKSMNDIFGIHFVTLEKLTDLHPSKYVVEWQHIVNSGIFNIENS